MSSLYGTGAKFVGQMLLIGSLGGVAGTGVYAGIRKIQQANNNRKLESQQSLFEPNSQVKLTPFLQSDAFYKTS